MIEAIFNFFMFYQKYWHIINIFGTALFFYRSYDEHKTNHFNKPHYRVDETSTFIYFCCLFLLYVIPFASIFYIGYVLYTSSKIHLIFEADISSFFKWFHYSVVCPTKEWINKKRNKDGSQ